MYNFSPFTKYIVLQKYASYKRYLILTHVAF